MRRLKRLAMDAPEVRAVIEANYRLGQAMEINGTPTFVMGGNLLRGYVEYPQMEAIIAAAREG
jgi:protein-disulfide isomerase